MFESPYWVGWSAGSWSKSWGWDVEVEEQPGGGSSKKRKKEKQPGKALDDRDLLEVLTIVISTGLLWHSQTASRR